MIIFLQFILCLPLLSLEKQWIQFSNGKRVEVEVAKTFNERNQGLMERTKLENDKGMLFVFESPQKLSFWMKNTYIPLSIAYFDENRKLKEIYDMKPQNMMEKNQDLTSYPSECRCQYALEMRQGWFESNKIKPDTPGKPMVFQFVEIKK